MKRLNEFPMQSPYGNFFSSMKRKRTNINSVALHSCRIQERTFTKKIYKLRHLATPRGRSVKPAFSLLCSNGAACVSAACPFTDHESERLTQVKQKLQLVTKKGVFQRLHLEKKCIIPTML